MLGRAKLSKFILFPNPKAASAIDARRGADLDDVGDEGGDCIDLPLVLLETRPSLRAARCHKATKLQLVCTCLYYRLFSFVSMVNTVII